MEFIPLTLGTPRPRRAPKNPGHDPREPPPPARDYDEWREAREGSPETLDELPAARALERLRSAAPAGEPRRPWIVLGEPGAGKTRLLAHWHDTWLGDLTRTPPRLGLPVPALLRFRDLPADALDGAPDVVADRLWAAAAKDRRAALNDAGGGANAEALDTLPGRLFTPVWLLDGLDEFAAPSGIAAPNLWATLAALPGLVVLTCRRAVFDAARHEAARRIGLEFRIAGLKPGAEQEAFLAAALRSFAHLDTDSSRTRARDLIRALNANPALRPLATSPQLLVLVAEASDRLVLPRSRAAFYRDAIEALWARKLAGRPDLGGLARERDDALAALARTLGPSRAEATAADLRDAGIAGPLKDALERSGLLRLHGAWGSAEFRHLTFQEYYLARSLAGDRHLSEQDVRDVLDARWSEVEWEETLALLLASQAPSVVEAALSEFVRNGLEAHRRDPRLLWRLRRSPTRFALQVLGRSGIALLDPLPGGLGAASPMVHLALAKVRGAPPEMLAALAHAARERVRQAVAWNSATPPEALATLALDAELRVRWAAAWNPATPPDALAALARDADWDIWLALTINPATLPETRAILAREVEGTVRSATAENPTTPPEALAVLAGDAEEEVRRAVAGNRAAPLRALITLAQDAEWEVRRAVAWNPTTPSETRAALCRDAEGIVRSAAAENPMTLPGALAVLACDADEVVRRAVAGNAATPAEVRAVLACDVEGSVRSAVARNPVTAPGMLVVLAGDANRDVRSAAADNPATPPGTLAVLAFDGEEAVRLATAGNPATPPEARAVLARDAQENIRWVVAANLATLPEVQAVLARDVVGHVREAAAENPATIIEDLW